MTTPAEGTCLGPDGPLRWEIRVDEDARGQVSVFLWFFSGDRVVDAGGFQLDRPCGDEPNVCHGRSDRTPASAMAILADEVTAARVSSSRGRHVPMTFTPAVPELDGHRLAWAILRPGEQFASLEYTTDPDGPRRSWLRAHVAVPPRI